MSDFLKTILIDYPLLAPIIFIIVRMLPLIIPPIPGLLIDVVGVAVFGWFYGFLLAETGVVLASMISFFIARKFREPLLGKFMSLQKIHQWENKLTEREKFWGLISVRLISSPFFDTVNYAAGLTNIKASTYFWTTIIVSAPLGFMIYYFGEVILNVPIILIVSVILIIPFILWFKRKKGQTPDLV
ncbi:TVP38/TMEM64 family protein [Candidatus Nomurabacteria bacterium]|nr:TVP38/TMEM64 family protein [Candidatus Nomurabacteria bacterium]